MKLLFSLFFLFYASVVFALNDNVLLKRANKNLYSHNKTDVFKAYNDFKTLYLHSIINEDEKLKKKALIGIVRSGRILHIDVSEYQAELEQTKKQTHYQKPKPKPIKRSKKLQTVKQIKKIAQLKKLYWHNERLILEFNKNLSSKDINYKKTYDGRRNIYRYIFDIRAYLQRSQTLQKRGIDAIRVVQYDRNTLRVVFQNSSVLKVRFAIDGKKLRILVQPTHKISSTKVYTKTYRNVYNKNQRKKIIVIDPGHGGKDPGAVGYRRYREKMVVLSIGKYLKHYLEAKGYKVYMTRSDDRFIKLSRRTKYANKKEADLFISIHANASRNKKAQGIETYFLSPSRSDRAKRVAAMENKAEVDEMNYYGKQSFLMFLNNHKIIASNKLAIDLQQGMLLNLRRYYKDIVDSGVREGPFWVLVGAQMPAVLIEVGFITNPKEAKRLVNKNYQKRIAKGIAEGVERYFIKNR